ncbi:MAG: hypothetical protein K2X60_11660 [Xanthobacteraceae bacterium]|nr:hypothetical protein [Xanthobacteraceae bacterium]
MTSRVSWSVEGIEPSVREKAEAAARRAGMSLSDWMNAAVGGQTPAAAREAQDVAEIHGRLDAIARQVEQISVPTAPARGDPNVARQLNEAISRLDARLSHISNSPHGTPRPAQPPMPERPSYASAQLPPVDFSIAEIVARQGELDGRPQRQPQAPYAPQPPYAPQSAPVYMPPQMAAPLAPNYPDFSGLEKQLFNITHQIDTLRRPDGIEQSIAAFRTELADIRVAITEALPRRAIESLESEIRSLGQRIDETRQHGIDGNALSGIEHALADIRGELRSLTPAEQLAGFDDAIRNLGGKIDMIVRSSGDPGTIHQLDDAIAALKTIVANIASNDVMAQIADNVRTLSMKVDQLSQSGGNSDFLAALEQRIGVLTSALEQRDRPAADSSYFDNAVRTISDRLDHLQVGNDSSSTFTHVEQRVAHLLERLEATEGRPGNLGRVEDGLSEILRLLQQQRAPDNYAQHGAAPMDQGFIDAIKRELSDMRYSQSETDRHTQDSLEVVHSTLGHVVDRLAHIEGDLRERRTTPPPFVQSHFEPQRAAPPSMPPQQRPELPNPALVQAHATSRLMAQQPPAAIDPPSLRDIAIESPSRDELTAPAAAPPHHAARTPIDPDLPPDHPLEPGTRYPQGRGSSPSERIAASEGALKDIAANTREPVSSSNFIQAARRAAQAAQTATTTPASATPKANRVTALNDAARLASKTPDARSSPVSSRIRAILVGAGVIVIVFGTVKMAMNLLNSGDPAMPAPATESSAAPPVTLPPAEPSAPKSENLEPAAPSMTSPTPIGKQSMSAPASDSLSSWTGNMPNASAMSDVTGAVASPYSNVPGLSAKTGKKVSMTYVPVSEQLPEAIGSISLRSAALKGDPGAAYEIGLRYADGRGVPANFDEAAKWYNRAAQADIVPAIFRLGTFYEKGLGVKKDADTASRYYRQAAERGNAKAMHNLAVLEADGGGKTPNYKSASEWFRKAAERGIADSQFNLGILYARGIGVEQNLAESYKWFSLAAAQGDVDSGRKRDDIARRLDAQSLAAAKLAIQTFTPEQQPADAINVSVPAGGWDAAPAQKRPAKPAKPATSKAAAPTKTAVMLNPS